MNPTPVVQFPDYLVLVAVFALITAVGSYYSREMKDAGNFFAAGNAMPWWLAGTSFFMASFSTLLFVVYNEIAYRYGLVAVTIVWVHGFMTLFAGMLLGHRWRRTRVMTPVAFMQRRYNRTVHQFIVWTGLPLRMLDNGVKVLATAIVIAAAFRHSNLTSTHVAAIIGGIIIINALLGGQKAVIITDFILAVILAVAVLTLFVLTWARFDGVGDFLAKMPAGHLRLTTETYDWTYLVFTMAIQGFLVAGAGWALVQKFNCVRSEPDIRKMVYWITFLKVVSPPIFFFPGLAARYLMPAVANPRTVYADVVLDVLPVGMVGLMLAAMFSATNSALGSDYNTLSGILTRDFYKSRINPDAREDQQVRFGRIATLLIGTVTVLIAILLKYIEELHLMDIIVRIFSAFGPPMMIPLVVGLTTRRLNARGAVWGIVSGITVGVSLVLLNVFLVRHFAAEMKANPVYDYWLRGAWNSITVVSNVLAVLIGMWLGSATRPTPADERTRVEEFFGDLARPFVIERTVDMATSPFRLIGSVLAMFGGVFVVVALYVLLVMGNRQAFWVDVTVGGFIAALGLLLRSAAWIRRGSPDRAAKSLEGT